MYAFCRGRFALDCNYFVRAVLITVAIGERMHDRQVPHLVTGCVEVTNRDFDRAESDVI